jgi:hypothetical protein
MRVTSEKKTDDRNLAVVSPAIAVTTKQLDPVKVSNVRTGDNFVSFDVDKVGVPVLVRTSYFPNWKVAGATGPYRAAPNFMVVVPTSTSVRLSYGYTSVDLGGYGATAVGVLGTVWLWRRKREELEPLDDDAFVTTSVRDPFMRFSPVPGAIAPVVASEPRSAFDPVVANGVVDTDTRIAALLDADDGWPVVKVQEVDVREVEQPIESVDPEILIGRDPILPSDQ